MLWQWLFPRVLLQSPRKWGILYWIPFFANPVLYSGIQSPTPDRQSQWKRQAPESKEIQRCKMYSLEDIPIWKYNHTNATVTIEAKKLPSEELTDWREPARDESIVDISFQSKIIRNHCSLKILPNLSKPINHAPFTLKSRNDPGLRCYNRLPWGVVSWNLKVALTTVTKSCLTKGKLMPMPEHQVSKLT